MSKEKRRRWVDLLILLAILAVITVVRLSNPPEQVILHIENNVLSISSPEEKEYTIPLDEIRSVRLDEKTEYIEEGREGHEVLCGEYAEVTQCVYAKIPVSIYVESTTGTFRFNCESEELTKAFYEAFIELL